jgi:hypothetical protein
LAKKAFENDIVSLVKIQIQFSLENKKKSAKKCKKTRTNSQQISEDFFLKMTLFSWLKFKSIQIQFFLGNKIAGKFCKKTRINSKLIGEEFF